MNDFIPDEENFEVDLDALLEAEADAAPTSAAPVVKKLTLEPLFRTLFLESIDRNDVVLHDFATHVVGPLSNYFALKAAKGGKFFEEKQAEGAKNAERYGRDQTLRAHLINGMLPALHVARLLAKWGAKPLRGWDEQTERLFIAGYMLHDFLKIDAAQNTLKDAGFKTYFEMSSPSDRQVEVLERIFIEWGGKLGLEAFLQPVGGLARWVQELIYIACNTQVLGGTINNPRMLPKIHLDTPLLKAVTLTSHLADIIAYVAPTPREMVAHEAIKKLIGFELGDGRDVPSVARLTYHHVAENRGLLLNLIHNAALDALKIDDVRVPLLYAPSGVVYLERHDAPAMPNPEDLAKSIVAGIRQKAGDRLIASGKGAKRGNTSLQLDDSYDDFFSVPEMVQSSIRLVGKYITNNKMPNRMESVLKSGWSKPLPPIPTEAKDARADQIAEWAAFIDKLYRERMNQPDKVGYLLTLLGIEDLAVDFSAVKEAVGSAGGVPLWWYWAGAQALGRKTGMSDVGTLQWLTELSEQVIASLPEDLPEKAQANQTGWDDLTDYVGRVLTLGGAKHLSGLNDELKKYTRAKGGGGKACAICGSTYTVRAPKESTVAFQPGVYTARIPIGSSSNARNLCSICSLEQLLRQLYMDNLDTGSTAEGQRIRYLSFYPSYYFTPETLRFMQRAYQRISDMRVSDKEFMAALREADLTDPNFWQRLEMFLMPVRDEPSKRVLRYQADAQSTFLSFGLRVFDAKTETEAWILPALMALVLSVCLDVKVVISDSGVPLMLEADELPETLWFDGVHPAVQAVMGGSRLNIDRVGGALARLAAAYMIHLDTEYQPPKENWNRFGPIAHSLMESPLYLFHYLKKQQREDRPLGFAQVQRYIRFAETLFSHNAQGVRQMSLARDLVTHYRKFYRAKNNKNANSVLRPLSVVADALLIADPRLYPDAESLTELAFGELAKFMDRVGKGQADGRFPKGVHPSEREAGMREFSAVFVENLFIGIFNKDVAALRGKQLNLFRDTCEALYRQMQVEEWTARDKDAEETEEDDGADE